MLSTLTSMAQACEELEHDESQLVYLKLALDFNPKDVAVNRAVRQALARSGNSIRRSSAGSASSRPSRTTKKRIGRSAI